MFMTILLTMSLGSALTGTIGFSLKDSIVYSVVVISTAFIIDFISFFFFFVSMLESLT